MVDLPSGPSFKVVSYPTSSIHEIGNQETEGFTHSGALGEIVITPIVPEGGTMTLKQSLVPTTPTGGPTAAPTGIPTGAPSAGSTGVSLLLGHLPSGDDGEITYTVYDPTGTEP